MQSIPRSFRFPTRSVCIIIVALPANGQSSYRDAEALVKYAHQTWSRDLKTVVITDRIQLIQTPNCIGVRSASELLHVIQSHVARHSPNYDILFTLSAHGYRQRGHEFVRVRGQNVTDWHLARALYSRMDSSCVSLSLLDTCHSGTLLDLPWRSVGVSGGRRGDIAPGLSYPPQAFAVSACEDQELTGEDISRFAGWGGKLTAHFLDHFNGDIILFFRVITEVFSKQQRQTSHPVLSWS